MRVPVSWLADYVDLSMDVDELAHRLTMAGIKVETIERIGEDWQDVRIGQVVQIEPHPRSNKPLHVARVDVGDGSVPVVTGAQNVHLGDKAPIVLVGGLLPHGPDGQPTAIQARPMAGITSEGMLASARELGISDEHEGIFILPPDAPVGQPLRSYLGDDILDIETNPNRPDTLSIIGIAREVAAITEQQLTLPDLDAIDGQVEWVDEESLPVDVDAPDLCPRYSALRVEGVTARPSPRWLAARLEAAGMRPISSLVDITNYVMLEYGQPMHAFDATRLRGGAIVVRRARDGERLRTLDGVDRALQPDNLVIADADRAAAVAGVMGGEDSEITPETATIVLESANFDPVSVRRTAQALALRTESSARFEKGLPPEQTILGLKRYLQLLSQITEGPLRVARISDVWVGPSAPLHVSMPVRDLDRLLGIQVPREVAAEKLSLLGFEVTVGADALSVLVPFWRRADIGLSADIVEEVSRLVGFDRIPATLPKRTMEPASQLPALHWEDVVRRRLLAAGVNEVVTRTLTSVASMRRLVPPGSDGHDSEAPETWARLVPNPAGVYAQEALTIPLSLINPPSHDRDRVRLTLLPSLLDIVARNLKHGEERLAFFEIARTYFKRPEDLPYERRTLAVALSGRRLPRSWESSSPEPYSFYDLKGMLEAVLDELQVGGFDVQPADHPSLHPGRSARLCLGGTEAAFFGQLHPDVAAAFDIEGWPVQVAEVDLDVLFSLASDVRIFHPLPRHPAARRDIAVVLSSDVPAGRLMQVIKAEGGDLLERAEIFDVYSGDPLPVGKKSIAVALELRAPGVTLKQEEVSAVMERITAGLRRELDATLRE